jgi:phytoene dehydrogenase-like protein
MAAYDGIIIGAGHNGLILQAYLGKAGLKTLCIERRHVAGGGLSTVEDPRHPGFLHNTHAFFQRAITAMPWYADLELERHGARYIEPELNVALLTGDGGALEWWTDIDRTVASFGEFSRRDADTLRRWQHEFVPILRDILIPESRSIPVPPEERRAALKKSAAGRRLLEVSALSPLEFVHQEFEHPTVKAGLLFFNGCARSTCASKASAITSRRCSRAPPRHRCRAAALSRLHALSKPRCARAAVRYY